MDFKICNETLIAYRHQPGSGPVVVCAHALGCDQSIWEGVLQALGPTQARLTYDLRGHGASGRDSGQDGVTVEKLGADLIALLEALGMQQVILCGVSIGGMVAQHVAAVRPDLLRGLVLCNTAPRIGTVERWEARIAAVRAQGLPALADDILAQWFPPAFKSTAPEAWAGHKAMLQRNDPDAYTRACAALRDADLTAATAGITLPTTCVSGSADGSVTPAQVADLAGCIAGAQHVTLDGVGHLPCLDAPNAVAQVIRDMIDRTAPTQTRQQVGMAVRRAVLGDAHVNRAEGARTAFDDAFQTLITEGAWGTVWASDAISLRERSMLTLALLAALGNFDEIPMHVRATARTGASESDLREVFQHVAIYAGVPRANHALKLAKQTLAEMRGAVMTEAPFKPRDLGAHPPPLYPDYRSTHFRAPAHARLHYAPSATEMTGPVFGQGMLGADDADLIVNYAAAGQAALGPRILVHGVLRDQDARPMPGKLIEVWQANAGGRYRHKKDGYLAPLDPNFGGCGRCVTGPDGTYSFRTVQPGPYPWPNGGNDWRPAHIHFSVFGDGFAQRLITQMYFEGDPHIALCPIVQSVPDPKGIETLVARLDMARTVPMDIRAYRFDITLRGRDATYFENFKDGT